MAVIMGIETSVPFGCTFKALPGGDVPASACTPENLDAAARRGARRWACARWSSSTSSTTRCPASPATTARSVPRSTPRTSSRPARFWDMRHCEPADPDAPRPQPGRRAGHLAPASRTRCSARSRSSSARSTCPRRPLYPPPDHCNSRGLTTLGEYTIKGLAKRHMIFDPDHMSVKARQSSLDLIEEMELPRHRLSPLLVDRRRLPPHLPGRRLHHAVRRRLDRLRREVAARTSAGPTSATTGASGTART